MIFGAHIVLYSKDGKLTSPMNERGGTVTFKNVKSLF